MFGATPPVRPGRESLYTAVLGAVPSTGVQLRVAWIVVAALVLYIYKGALLGFHHPSVIVPVQPVRILPRARSSTMQVVSKRPRIVTFGDSLTQHGSSATGGWVAALQDYYARKVDVINRGYSGYNTRFAQYLPSHILDEHSEPPLLMTFFFGANDAALPSRVGYRQHVAVPEFSQHMRTMVMYAKERGVQDILLITPPPVNEAGRVQHQASVAVVVPVGLDISLPDRTNAHTKQYADAVKALANELRLPCIDLHTLMQVQSDWQQAYLLPDGLHFTAQGNLFVFEQVVEAIGQHFPHLRSEDLPFHFPPWSMINVTDPGSTFADVRDGKRINSPPELPSPGAATAASTT